MHYKINVTTFVFLYNNKIYGILKILVSLNIFYIYINNNIYLNLLLAINICKSWVSGYSIHRVWIPEVGIWVPKNISGRILGRYFTCQVFSGQIPMGIRIPTPSNWYEIKFEEFEHTQYIYSHTLYTKYTHILYTKYICYKYTLTHTLHKYTYFTHCTLHPLYTKC